MVKKIFGIMIAIIMLVCMTSCADPNVNAENRYLIDNLIKEYNKGQVVCTNAKVGVAYEGNQTPNQYIAYVNLENGGMVYQTSQAYIAIPTYDVDKLIQYNEYFEVIVGDKSYKFSNNYYSYKVYE